MTPMEVGFKLITKQAPTTIHGLNGMKKIPYQNIVGSLMYYWVCTHLDIPFAIGLIISFYQILELFIGKQ